MDSALHFLSILAALLFKQLKTSLLIVRLNNRWRIRQ